MAEIINSSFSLYKFVPPLEGPELLPRNTADLKAFVARLGGNSADVSTGLVGPFLIPGNDYIPSDIPLFIGKAACVPD